LAIVREIARLHGAEIFFARGADGHGLQVRIKFPDTLAAAA
jgi:signal transduction histidine kinase